eukprot:3809356-Amphidinium_carterae.2
MASAVHKEAPGSALRVILLCLFVGGHAGCGIIYLLAISNFISPMAESTSYLFTDTVLQVATLTTTSMIHKCDTQVMLWRMQSQMLEVNLLMSSLLRGSCSCVLNCVISEHGECAVEDKQQFAAELGTLQQMADGDIIGNDFREVIAGEDNRQRFEAYIRNVWLQAHTVAATSWQAEECQIAAPSRTAPLAQVLCSQLKMIDSVSSLPVTVLVSVPVGQPGGCRPQGMVKVMLGLQMPERVPGGTGTASKLGDAVMDSSVSQITSTTIEASPNTTSN